MDSSFDQLLQAARDGSPAALSQLLVPYQGIIDAYADKLLGMDLRKYMDSCDLTQEVFVVATASFTQFRGLDERSWIAWLKGICRHSVLAFLRDKAPRIRATQSLQAARQENSSFDVQALQTSIFGRVEKRHQEALFERALNWLPENDRLLLAKKYLGEQEVSWQELTAEFGTNEVALRRRASRLIELLRGGVRLLERIDQLQIPEPLADLLCLKFLQRLSIQQIAERSGEQPEKIKAFLDASQGLMKEPSVTEPSS